MMALHDVDSRKWPSKLPGQGLAGGCQKANPVLLEPVMKVVVVTPEELWAKYRRLEQQARPHRVHGRPHPWYQRDHRFVL